MKHKGWGFTKTLTQTLVEAVGEETVARER